MSTKEEQNKGVSPSGHGSTTRSGKALGGPVIPAEHGQDASREALGMDAVAGEHRTSPEASSTVSGRTISASGWSSRWTTSHKLTRRRTLACSTLWPRISYEHGYDIRHLERTILQSATYQRSAVPERIEQVR